VTGHPTDGREKPQGKKRFLLLVDGNARDLFTTGLILQRLEYDVYVSSSAEDALEIMTYALPALVVTEVLLPQMNGIDLLTRIKQESRTAPIPVVFHTAMADPKIEELCLAYGCASYLQKPVEPNDLYRAIQHATEITPRNYIRLRTFLRADVGGLPQQEGTGEPEVVTALSENGIYVRTLTPRPVKTVQSVEFMLGRSLVRVRATVLYGFSMNKGPFREPGMGMKFIDVSSGDRALISGFIKKQLTRDLVCPE
jgi:CheY-like chemotaxis protein